MLGYEVHEMAGAPLMKFVAPPHRDLVRGQEAGRGEEIYEHRALRKDGTVILVEARGRNCTFRGRPARLAVVRDVTQAALRASREAESVVRREKDRLDRAAAAGRVALWEWDLGTGILEWTSIVDGMLGLPPGGFPRTVEAWASQVHPDDVEAVVAALDRHLHQDLPYDSTYRIRRADGSYMWWHDAGYAERDATGKPFRMAGTCVDVTEKKKTEEAERALQTSERWLEEAQRVAHLGWYSYLPASDVFSVSDTVEEMFGISPSYPHDSAGFLALVHPDDRERVRAEKDKAVAGEPTPDIVYRMVRPSDGQERCIHARLSAVFDTAGGDRAHPRDHAGRDRKAPGRERDPQARGGRRAGRAVRRHHGHERHDPVRERRVHDDDGLRAGGRDRQDAQAPQERAPRRGALRAPLAHDPLGGQTWRGRFTNRKSDGSLYEADAIITPVRDSLGNLSCFVCLEHDITEVLAEQKKRQEQEKLAAIGEIAANIAHEVKNPLFAISSGIQLLMEELALDDRPAADLRGHPRRHRADGPPRAAAPAPELEAPAGTVRDDARGARRGRRHAEPGARRGEGAPDRDAFRGGPPRALGRRGPDPPGPPEPPPERDLRTRRWAGRRLLGRAERRRTASSCA